MSSTFLNVRDEVPLVAHMLHPELHGPASDAVLGLDQTDSDRAPVSANTQLSHSPFEDAACGQSGEIGRAHHIVIFITTKGACRLPQ